MEGFTDALRREMYNWKMKIILIEPGFFQTNMVASERATVQWNELWSELSDDKKLEYGEEFFISSKIFSVAMQLVIV